MNSNTILFLDLKDHISNKFKMLLEEQKHKTIFCPMEKAIEAIEKENPDLVITGDISIYNNFSMISQLRKHTC
jgi:DNA-binding NtrC family response regulator